MNDENKQKILLCGDVEGHFNALFKRVNSIIKKSGQFDLLICVGNFFGTDNEEFNDYKSRNKKVPLPTYILGPNKEEHIELYPQEDEELCPNLYYLGKRGIFTNSKGLKIAYISGKSSSGEDSNEKSSFNRTDMSELFDLCVRGNPAFRGVDILLCSQWPTGIVFSEQTSIKPTNSTELPSWLIMKLKPRYIISGLEGIYYERPPFRIPSLGDHDSTIEISSRFIGLANVDNSKKDKWLYALSLTPLDKMKISDLIQKTTDETACPFDFEELQSQIFKTKRKDSGMKQYFYDTSSTEDQAPKKRRREKVQFDQEKCWFCLASPTVEKHLIVTVGDHCYMALAKGGVVEEHFLICPIQHYQNYLSEPEPVKLEMEQFKRALYKFYARENKVPIFFERNYKTSHMQLQAIPVSKRATKELKEIFMEEAEGNGFSLEVLEDQKDSLDQVLPPKAPYFVVELPSGVTLYTKIKGGDFPINFGREVLCAGPILNLPDRCDWRECTMSKEEEGGLVQRIRTDFEPYDFCI